MTAPQPPYGGDDRYQQQPPYTPPPGSPYPGQPMPYPSPQGAYGGVDQYGRPLSDKSKIAAGLLGIFLGGFGVGRFYLGYTTIGILQLVVSVITLGIGSLWGFIDGIIIITGGVPDAQGRTLRD